ncbi:tripartite tricarboxylate transporter TctB family protein [Microbacterium sp. NPDC091313]
MTAIDTSETTAPPSWWTGRAGLLVPAVLFAFAAYLTIGVLTMRVPAGAASPGPQFFPALVAVAGYVVAVLLAVQIIRHPEVPVAATYSADDDVSDAARAEAQAAASVRYRFFSDWRSVAWAAGGFLAFALLLSAVGWILSAALLVWCVARAMGSTKPVLDVVVALTMSSLAYLAFDVLLGLELPSGLLGGL